jgi:diketogulonate reductase-like aldo/keto reductase
MPPLLYGTAWKEAETQRLTELALRTGFRGIDTANQRRHYDEAAVGRGIQAVIASGLVTRDDLFLQTKYTFLRGQDHRLPYDPRAPIADQVAASFASSLEHLGVETIDSYLLHGPTQRIGLTDDDWSAWRAMESLHDSGRVRHLGISNVSLDQLESLCAQARIQPAIVQNRCYASRAWDRPIRDFCTSVSSGQSSHGITYQGFSLLTANPQVLSHPTLAQIATHHQKTPAQILFRFVQHLSILPLTGTTNETHMQQDLATSTFALTPAEVHQIEQLSAT